MSFLLIWMPAHRDFSIDARLNPSIRSKTIANWPMFLLQFQLGVVYFFAGVAKLHPDWLFEAQPLKLWLQAHRDLPVVGDLLASSWVAFAFSWFGCIYDLTIPFFLSSNRTRNFAYLFVVGFHVITWLLFPIGVFPWVMICSTLIYFPHTFHERLLTPLKNLFRWKEGISIKPANSPRKWALTLVAIYCFVQIALPFRYAIYPGNLFWTEEGFRFSWRVMLMEKKGYATFYVQERITGNRIEIDNYQYLSMQQIDQMSRQPDMILQFAHFIAEKYADTTLHFGTNSVHLRNPAVVANVFVTLNGRTNQLFIRDTVDLSTKSYDLKHRTWLEPFRD